MTETSIEEKEAKLETAGAIIDVFEQFLADRGITLDNAEKTENDNTLIVGTDYFELEDAIVEIL
jgi:hypothetical protein